MQNIKSDFKQWIAEQLKAEDFHVQPLRNDASFRSYYRVEREGFRYVVMDAPPEREKTDTFVEVAKAWHGQALPVPQIYGWEPKKGYVLLSDFGDTLLLDVLTSENAQEYYRQAIALLLRLQRCAPRAVPCFDEAYIRYELGLFEEWFCEKLLGLSLNRAEKALLEDMKRLLVANSLEQPQVVIHRDYHSRNLMIREGDEALGIIDFQDAMIGPVTYDLVSILKDCYIRWPIEVVEQWALEYREGMSSLRLALPESAVFLQWFDWTGLQRHLKVLGVFSRLKIRDNKDRYLQDIPRIMEYVREVTMRYPALASFDAWLRGLKNI